MHLIGYVVLCALSFGVAAYAVVVYGLMPVGSVVHPDMRAVFEGHRFGIYTHVFASAIALALGPLQFSSRLRRNHASVHHWMGRFYLGAGVLIGGLAGLYMAFHAFGGVIARLGFACLALAWLYSGLRAYLAIRAGDVAVHRAWMVRNFALSFAAVTLRLYMPAAVVTGVGFETAYPFIAWLCWVPNVIAAELLFNRTNRPPTLLKSKA
jgi:uncharacterized membrane protein